MLQNSASQWHTNGSIISFSLMACGSSWASSASGCTAGVALFHLFSIFLLGPACWLRHGVLKVANAEVQGNKRDTQHLLSWLQVAHSHFCTLASDRSQLRGLAQRQEVEKHSWLTRGSWQENGCREHWDQWYNPTLALTPTIHGLCPSALSLGQSLDTPSDLCLFTETVMCSSCFDNLPDFSLFFWILQSWNADSLFPVPS